MQNNLLSIENNTIYCPLQKAMNWLIWKCEDEVNLHRLETDFEGCLWIPIHLLGDYMQETTLTKLLSHVGEFTYEETTTFSLN